MKKQKHIYHILVTVFSVAALAAALIYFGPANDEALSNADKFPVVMNEIMASNSSYPNDDGIRSDYIEFYNTSDEAFDLHGYSVTDSGKVIKHTFPEGTVVPAKGYYLLYCDSASPNADWAKFSISKDTPETIYLIDHEGTVLQHVNTVPVDTDMAIVYDGIAAWSVTDAPTPGYENTQTGHDAWLAHKNGSLPTVRFNELLASNDLYYNQDGVACDWIEFFNYGQETVHLDGCAIVDSRSKELYIFPSGSSIAPNSYFVLQCSKSELGDHYADFGISKDKEEKFVLITPSGLTVDSITSVPLGKNLSYGIDSSGSTTALEYVTPGYANTAEGYSSYITELGYHSCDIIFTEVMPDNQSTITDSNGRFSDWFELTNVGESACDLSGWYLSDNDDVFKWEIDSLVIPAGESVIVFCSDEAASAKDEHRVGFSLSSRGETLTLASPLGTVYDSVSYGAVEKDRSYYLDFNSGEWCTDIYATPGLTNDAAGYEAYCASRAAAGPLMISELQTANDSYYRYAYQTYYDWVEICNISNADVNLADYYISDNCEDPTMFRLPDVVLAPGEYYSVLCPGDDSLTNAKYVCTNFALNALEDSIYLFDMQGRPVDYAFIFDVPTGCSFGRSDKNSGFGYFEDPTPGEENESCVYMISAEPTVSVKGGIYDGIDGLDVELLGEGTIYYTLDGNVPTTKSKVYTGPIHIDSTTVLRAVAVQDGMLTSTVLTESYFVNEEHTLPVVSLVSPHNGLFSNATGIYVGGNSGVNYYLDWERAANVALYEHGGTGSAFEIDCGLKMFGSGSREYCDKKSFKLLFKNQYEGQLAYDVFGDGDATVFYSLVLRAGEDYRFGLIRDDVCGTLARQGSDAILVQNTRSVILYINGEYWGIYSIKEQFSQEFYATYFNVPPESVIVERAPLTDGEMYSFMRHTLANYDLTTDEGLEYLCQYIDIYSLIDWMIFQAYAGNTDISVNLRYARSTEGDGLWRWCYYDLDWTLYVGANFNEVLEDNMQYGAFARRLIHNETFQRMFCMRLAELCETTLSRENVNEVIDYYVELISPEIERERARWRLSMASWESNIGRIRGLVNDRDRCWELIDSISTYMRLSDAEIEEYFGHLRD